MTSDNRTITTMVDTDFIAQVEICHSETRDHIILIREAIHPIRTGAVKEINVKVQMAEWTLTVEARK